MEQKTNRNMQKNSQAIQTNQFREKINSLSFINNSLDFGESRSRTFIDFLLWFLIVNIYLYFTYFINSLLN